MRLNLILLFAFLLAALSCTGKGALVYEISEDKGQFYLLDSLGKHVSEQAFDEAFFSHGMIVAKKDGKYGVLDSCGRTTADFCYQDLEGLDAEYLLAEQDGKHFIIDRFGRQLTSERYDTFQYSFNKSAVVSVDAKYGLVRLDGSKVLPTEYDYLKYCTDNMAIAAKGNMVFLVDNHGKVLAEKELDGQVRDVDEVFDIMEDTYEEIQEKGQLYWDGILDEYEALCDKCIELRTIIGSGGILPDNSISSLLEQSAQLKGALSDAFGHMSENQLDRFGTIQEKYTYLTR